MRFSCDTGGTFTDLVVEDDDGRLHLFKAPTVPSDPVQGVLDACAVAAGAMGVEVAALLGKGELFIHGTTRAINAIVTGTTARTALLTTRGNPDVMFFREGGRIEPFNYTVPYPQPYIPRALTFEVPERVTAAGAVAEPLDEDEVRAIAARLRDLGVEAVAVSLLWAIANPAHELRVGQILSEELPGVPVTLGHEVNPIIREYRRTAAAAIDASLKPLMGAYMRGLESRLRQAGYAGRVLVVTSQGGVLDAMAVAATPIHAINSGPAMAPVAGRYFAEADAGAKTAVVADTGGTTYDVSLIRNGAIPWTRETWLGQPFRSDMTGFPSVDVRSVGAGGGSIATVDRGGMLRVGPASAGAVPGPACYGKGGTKPTVTDAALVLGYIDPDNFLGGAITLDRDAAIEAVRRDVAGPLGFSVADAAAAIIDVVTEGMVQAIADITVNQGIDPASAVLIGGGGAAGLNSVLIARRLRCSTLLIPETGAALSAAGGLISDLSTHFRTVLATRTDAFDFEGVAAVLSDLRRRCEEFLAQTAEGSVSSRIEFLFDGHYPSQVWDIDVPMVSGEVRTPADVKALAQAFHDKHRELFAVSDDASPVEIVSWQANVSARLWNGVLGRVKEGDLRSVAAGVRRCYFRGIGEVEAKLLSFEGMSVGETVTGPAIVESPLTTVVVNPGAVARKAPSGSLVIDVG